MQHAAEKLLGARVAGMAEHLKPESVDLCVTSIPFGALFSYSGKTEDIGSTLIAVAVGALVTLGPLALLQSG